MDITELEQILKLLRQNEVTKFELQREGTTLRISRAGNETAQSVSPAAIRIEPAIVGAANGQVGMQQQAAAAAEDSGFVKVESPIVGTFYRKPSPDAEPFVKEGDRVSKGDTLCIVEAMKLMNEIDAPCDGVIQRVMLSDGHVVEFGEVLFLINPS
ncbi:MAG: acetyl-CoA carboxylase biotin carboxyl carrier protein [Oligoflexia bacterium]|nr:acetyl-CoA carboxylase biotin carboxyl carrier protein [Oligoflexia bacterium]